MGTASELSYKSDALAVHMARAISGDVAWVVRASARGGTRSAGVYSRGRISYACPMFGRRQAICSEGKPADNLLSEPQKSKVSEQFITGGKCTVYPELKAATHTGNTHANRRSARGYPGSEAHPLSSQTRAA